MDNKQLSEIKGTLKALEECISGNVAPECLLGDKCRTVIDKARELQAGLTMTVRFLTPPLTSAMPFSACLRCLKSHSLPLSTAMERKMECRDISLPLPGRSCRT